ncbi:MAG: asparagine synthase (glutamine-hydrolyzing) [Lachnospiraceae bacterium]|nr:asparagine synthase (glutamine-hydrolyzing) [Lachnospiraceae bacterium]
MCGIAGYISASGTDKEILKKMTDRIAYRGPDAEGFYLDTVCALGHRRLSIIDLAGGGQPIFNEDGSVVVVFNGEIYNYLELREELKSKGHTFKTNSDTEVLVHGFEEWGTLLTKRLRGMFAFAIWDKTHEKLYIARDRWGIKPLYYCSTGRSFLFASEIKAFLDHPEFKKELNTEILSAYLCFNSTPTEETFFKGVYRLEPGTQLIYEKGCLKKEEYFVPEIEETAETVEHYAEEISRAMEDSVQHHKIADVEVGSFLSSGIDSSYLVSIARPERTFTVGYSDERYDETAYASELAEKLGLGNESEKITKEEYIKAFPDIIYHMDEPLADPSAIALYFVARLASKRVKVVLSGEGADEFFGGYNSYQEEVDDSGYMKLPFAVRHALSALVSPFPEARGLNYIYRRGKRPEDYYIGLGRVFRDSEAKRLVRFKDQISTASIVKPLFDRYEKCSSLTKRQLIDFRFWLVNDFLHAVDRNTMMFSLEARTPFLDDAVYEVARHLPAYAKVDKKTTKIALRTAAKKTIPTKAYEKKKLGFPVPLREWMRDDDLHDMIRTEFEGENAGRFFDRKKIMKLLEKSRTDKGAVYKKVWTVYTFLVWYRTYFEAA